MMRLAKSERAGVSDRLRGTMTTMMTTTMTDEFITPDPVMARTQRETRLYLLTELERWLLGPVIEGAKAVALTFPDPATACPSSAAERVYFILWSFEHQDDVLAMLPTDYDMRFRVAAKWAFTACELYLTGAKLTERSKVEDLAIGIVATDLLACGKTIESLWNHSPFEVLRSAPPLSDREEEEEEADGLRELLEPADDDIRSSSPLSSSSSLSASDNEDYQGRKGIDAGIDDFLTNVQVRSIAFLTSDHTILVPGWVVVGLTAWITVYMSALVAVCSRH